MSYVQGDLNYLWGQGHVSLLQHETDSKCHIQQTSSIASTISCQQNTLESAQNDSLVIFSGGSRPWAKGKPEGVDCPADFSSFLNTKIRQGPVSLPQNRHVDLKTSQMFNLSKF